MEYVEATQAVVLRPDLSGVSSFPQASVGPCFPNPSFASCSPSIRLGADGTCRTFPGNLLCEQSGDMAAKPLLTKVPLNFHGCVINY